MAPTPNSALACGASAVRIQPTFLALLPAACRAAAGGPGGGEATLDGIARAAYRTLRTAENLAAHAALCTAPPHPQPVSLQRWPRPTSAARRVCAAARCSCPNGLGRLLACAPIFHPHGRCDARLFAEPRNIRACGAARGKRISLAERGAVSAGERCPRMASRSGRLR